MVDLKHYMPENFIEALKNKNISDDVILKEIKRFESEAVNFGFKEEEIKSHVSNKLKSYFRPFLRGTKSLYEALVYNASNIVDLNERMRSYCEKNEGKERPDGTIVKKGFHAWGFKKGNPIDDEPDYNQELIVGIELNNKLVTKGLSVNGSFLSDSSKIAKTGDIVNVLIESDKINDRDKFFLGDYKIVRSMSDEQLKQLVENQLSSYKKTIADIVQSDYKGFVIVEAVPGSFDGGRIELSDDTCGWDSDIGLVATMQNIDFQDGTPKALFFGDVYKNSNGEFFLKTSKTIVGEAFKKVDTTEANKKIAEQPSTFDEINTDEVL